MLDFAGVAVFCVFLKYLLGKTNASPILVLTSNDLPSRELTYPTWGKEKSLTQLVSSLEGIQRSLYYQPLSNAALLMGNPSRLPYTFALFDPLPNP